MRTDGLKLSSLQRIASKKLGASREADSAILLAKAIIQRPRLIDAILDQDGYITRESLAQAENVVFGNSDPSAFSPDPFHTKNNADLVRLFKEMFTELRDRSRDRMGFFEQICYVNIEVLAMMSKDPDEARQPWPSCTGPGHGATEEEIRRTAGVYGEKPCGPAGLVAVAGKHRRQRSANFRQPSPGGLAQQQNP